LNKRKHKTCKEEFDVTEGVIRIHNAKKDRQHNGQRKMDKQRSTKHYTENYRDRATRTPLQLRLNTDKQFLLY